MKKWLTVLVLGSVLGLGYGVSTPTSHAQADEDEAAATATELYIEINRSLIAQGQLPFGRDATLDDVAQTIADELSETGAYTSSPRELASAMGYPSYPDNSLRVISTPFNFIGANPPASVAFQWRGQLAGLMAEGQFREIGIGIGEYVAGPGGTSQTVYVIVLGSQPNVMPVVIGDGAAVVYQPNVSLYVHDELSLAYATNEETVQSVVTVKFAESEDGLADAEALPFADNHVAVPWTLSDDYGTKTVWAEVTDAKGATARYQAEVELADPATRPSDTPTTSADEITLLMTYGGDTFTLQLSTNATGVNLSDVYFTWLNDLRFYELDQADDLAGVDLENFVATDCLQIRVRGQADVVEVPACTAIYLEANEFTELLQVFWNPEFGEFKVYDGLTQLGTCSTRDTQCEIVVQ